MQLLQCTATLPERTGQWDSCHALPHCLGAVGNAASAIHCHTHWGRWAVELLQRTTSLPGASGQWNSHNALPHCLGLVVSATPAMHCLTVWGQWALELLQFSASPPRGSGQCNSCNAVAHCLGAVGSGTPAMRGSIGWADGESCQGADRCLKSRTPAMHCHTALRQWAMELLQHAASLHGGSGQ